MCPEAKFLDEIQTKVLKVFLLAIPGHLFTFALRFIFLHNHATSYSFFSLLLYTVKGKGGKPDRKAYSLPYGSGNAYRNLKSENLQDYAQKPYRNCTIMNWASVLLESPFASVSTVSRGHPSLVSLGRNFTSSQIFFNLAFSGSFHSSA